MYVTSGHDTEIRLTIEALVDLVNALADSAAEPADDPADVRALLHEHGFSRAISASAAAIDRVEERVGSMVDTLLLLPDAQPEPTVSWIDDRTLILASTPDFPKLVHSVNGEGLSAKGSRLGRLLTQAQGQLFFAVEIPEQVPESSESSSGPTKSLNTVLSKLQSPAAGPMQSLQTILLTLDAETGIELALSGATDTDANGKQVYEMLNGYLTLGRSMAAQNPQAAELLNHLELSQDGSDVAISISMSGDDVRAALQQSQAIADE